jgi:hypothetical protein
MFDTPAGRLRPSTLFLIPAELRGAEYLLGLAESAGVWQGKGREMGRQFDVNLNVDVNINEGSEASRIFCVPRCRGGSGVTQTRPNRPRLGRVFSARGLAESPGERVTDSFAPSILLPQFLGAEGVRNFLPAH